MYLYENLMLALESLKANKGRSILTMLGIIIGISSVIAILTLGNAMSKSVGDELSSLGSSNIYVYLKPKISGTTSVMPFSDSDLITNQMIENVEKSFGSKIVGIGLNKPVGPGKIRKGTKNSSVQVFGTNSTYEKTQNIKMKSGRYIKERDVKSGSNIAIVSDEMVRQLFNGQENRALGSEIVVSTRNSLYTFIVVGIYKYEENPMLNGPSTEKDKVTTIYIPLSTAESIVGKTPGLYEQFQVQAKSGQNIDQLSKSLTAYLNRYYEKNPVFEVDTQSVDSVLEQVNSVMNKTKLAISVIAGISLLVGGIGVMNIMLVSVTERTREIGVRKALGATNNAIRIQFIVESIIVCLIGGIIGILLGGGLGLAGSFLLKSPSLPTLGSIIVAVTFSMAIGIFFGYYPANKAAALNPIDALRYE